MSPMAKDVAAWCICIIFALTTASIAAGQRSQSAAQPATRASGGVREDFWETYPRSDGEARWMRISVDLAREFHFSAEQKVRVLQFARQVEIGPCIENTDSYY